MRKRIVVGLDPSEYSKAAVQVACERAKAQGGTVVAVAVIDLPGIERAESGAGVGGGHHARQAEQLHIERARETCGELLDQCKKICQAAKVACEPIERRGDPVAVLAEECMSADLAVLGARTFFHFETQEESGNSLQGLIRAQSCPVLVVPEKPYRAERIIFPYDGSNACANAMRMFVYQAGGEALADELILLHVSEEEAGSAEAMLAAPAKFLAAHGHQAQLVTRTGRPSDVVAAFVAQQMPATVVLGASAKGSVKEMIFGSVTKALLEKGSVELFVAR